jgi:periplasmic copper chaperone A
MKVGRAGWRVLATTAGMIISATAFAQPVAVKDAWIRAPAAGQKVAGAYMALTSPVTSTLISVASPVAGRVELHDTTMEAGVMKMREVERVPLPGGKPVRFQPGGLHVMLIDLKQPLKPGDKVPLTLRVELPNGTRSTFATQAEVRVDAQATGHHFH